MSPHFLPTVVVSAAYSPFIGGAELAVEQVIANSQHTQYLIVTAQKSRRLPKTEKGSNYTIIRLGFGLGRLDKHLFILFAFWWLLRHQRRFSVVWAVMANQAGLAALLFSLVTGRRYVLSLQEGDSEEWLTRRARILGPLYGAMFRRAVTLQVISQHLLRWAKRFAPGVPTFIIPNGVDRKKFAPVPLEQKLILRQALDVSPQTFVFVTVSRLVKKNGVDTALELFNRLRAKGVDDFLFLVVGDGPDRGQLEALTCRLGMSNYVRFVGEKANLDVPAYLQASDVFIRLSRSEGLGTAFIEAFACGLPVVATSVGGIPDLVTHGKNGFLTDPLDFTPVLGALRTLWDAGQYQQLSAAAHLTARGYDWADIAQRQVTLLSTYGRSNI